MPALEEDVSMDAVRRLLLQEDAPPGKREEGDIQPALLAQMLLQLPEEQQLGSGGAGAGAGAGVLPARGETPSLSVARMAALLASPGKSVDGGGAAPDAQLRPHYQPLLLPGSDFSLGFDVSSAAAATVTAAAAEAAAQAQAHAPDLSSAAAAPPPVAADMQAALQLAYKHWLQEKDAVPAPPAGVLSRASSEDDDGPVLGGTASPGEATETYTAKRKRRRAKELLGAPEPGSGARALRFPAELEFSVKLDRPLADLLRPGGPVLDTLHMQKLRDVSGALMESGVHVLEPLTLYTCKQLFELMASIAEAWKNSGKAAWKKRINKIKENARGRKARQTGLGPKELREIEELTALIREREQWETRERVKIKLAKGMRVADAQASAEDNGSDDGSDDDDDARRRGQKGSSSSSADAPADPLADLDGATTDALAVLSGRFQPHTQHHLMLLPHHLGRT